MALAAVKREVDRGLQTGEGKGIDTVVADAKDKIHKSCEIVKLPGLTANSIGANNFLGSMDTWGIHHTPRCKAR